MAVKPFSNLRRRLLERPGAADRIESYRRDMLVELELAELRQPPDLTQDLLAESLDPTQTRISRVEHEIDPNQS